MKTSEIKELTTAEITEKIVNGKERRVGTYVFKSQR